MTFRKRQNYGMVNGWVSSSYTITHLKSSSNVISQSSGSQSSLLSWSSVVITSIHSCSSQSKKPRGHLDTSLPLTSNTPRQHIPHPPAIVMLGRELSSWRPSSQGFFHGIMFPLSRNTSLWSLKPYKVHLPQSTHSTILSLPLSPSLSPLGSGLTGRMCVI